VSTGQPYNQCISFQHWLLVFHLCAATPISSNTVLQDVKGLFNHSSTSA
jgi:hypothetical protein